jgi:hypothetical protein
MCSLKDYSFNLEDNIFHIGQMVCISELILEIVSAEKIISDAFSYSENV